MPSAPQQIHLVSLPRDALDHTMDFLTGWEVLALGCASQSLYYEVERDQRVWQKRIPAQHTNAEVMDSPRTSLTWKQKYTAAQSWRLHGGDREDAIPLPSATAAKWESEAFSIDMWFCMLPRSPADPTSHIGGILLGAQSSVTPEQDEQKNPEFHQQLIHVDPAGNLYCSVTKNKPIVKTKLQLKRWYHVALTYCRELQCVYLDGALVHVIQEPFHVEWTKMKDLQFGTGFMTYGSKGRPSDEFVGWYGFHGLLDAHRVWDHALSMGDVQRLARGERVSHNTLPAWPSQNEARQKAKDLVHCTRPLERHYAGVSSR